MSGLRRKSVLAGFSLLEIAIAIVVTAIVLGFALNGGNRRSKQSEVQAAAEELALELLKAKNEAALRGVAVGLAFPGEGSLVAQRFYKVEGLGTLRMTKLRNWSKTYSDVYLAWGAHGTENMSTDPPTFADLSNLPASDPVILFSPEGIVFSRGLATEGDDLRVRIGRSPQGSGTGLEARLAGINTAWTVTVNRGGAVTSSASPQFPKGSTATVLNLAPETAPPNGSTLEPRITTVKTVPELFAYSDGTLRLTGPENQIKLLLEAESPQGDPLYVKWLSDGGQFSHTDQWVPMQRTTDNSRWTSSTLWTLPPDPDPNYTIRVEVRDHLGRRTTSDSDKELNFRVEQAEVGILYVKDSGARPIISEGLFGPQTTYHYSSWVRWMREDGTGDRKVSAPSTGIRLPNFGTAKLSPNGEMLAHQFNHTEPDGSIRFRFEVRDLDGELVQGLSGNGTLIGWDENSTALYVMNHETPPYSLIGPSTPWVLKEYPVDGGSPRIVFSRPMSFYADNSVQIRSWTVAIDSKATKLAYVKANFSGSGPPAEVMVVDLQTGTARVLSGLVGGDFPNQLEMSRGGNLLAAESANGTVNLYDVASGRELFSIGGIEQYWSGFQISPSEQFILHSEQTSRVRFVYEGISVYQRDAILRTTDGTEVYRKRNMRSACFSQHGKFLVVDSEDGLFKIELSTMLETQIGAPREEGIGKLFGATEFLD